MADIQNRPRKSRRELTDTRAESRDTAPAIAFATMLVLSNVAGVLEGMGVGDLRQSTQAVVLVTVLVWAAAHEIKTRRAR